MVFRVVRVVRGFSFVVYPRAVNPNLKAEPLITRTTLNNTKKNPRHPRKSAAKILMNDCRELFANPRARASHRRRVRIDAAKPPDER